MSWEALQKLPLLLLRNRTHLFLDDLGKVLGLLFLDYEPNRQIQAENSSKLGIEIVWGEFGKSLSKMVVAKQE